MKLTPLRISLGVMLDNYVAGLPRTLHNDSQEYYEAYIEKIIDICKKHKGEL